MTLVNFARNDSMPHGSPFQRTSRRYHRVLAGMIWTFISILPAAADDTELFVTDTRRFPESRPNVLLIMDTSAGLAQTVDTQAGYVPTVRYPGGCDHSRVYWRAGLGTPPTCSSNRWFERSALLCQRALDAFATGSGSHSDHFAQFDTAERGQWKRLDERQKSRQVECAGDGGYHGDGTDPGAVFPRNGDESRPWSSDPRDEIRWGQYPADRPYTIYDGNYLNWFHSSPAVPTRRLAVLKEAASTLLSRMDGVNVGLMATNFDQGGSVLFPLEDIATARTGIIDSIDAITPDGWSPLSETLYEAGQYFAGRAVEYGAGHGPQESAPGARDPNSGGAAYASPLRLGCQKNHIVLLTGGTPTQDVGADARIAALPDFLSLVGPGCDGAGDGACLDDMATYLFAADLSPSLPGHQNVVTHAIGLEADMPLLASTAIRGGGTNFTSTDGSSLLAALTATFAFVRDVQTHFAAPTVPVDSFNRLRNADDLYLAVFRPTENTRWPGNIKKFRLRGTDGAILDARGLAAVDPLTGWFVPDSRSFWSSDADGADVSLGGAASKIPEPLSRSVFTYLGEPLLSHAGNAVQRSNGLIDEALLGIGDPGDPTSNEIIDFIRGEEPAGGGRHPGDRFPRMGDPLHGKPVLVTYGGTARNPDPEDQIVFAATNDGFLHAIDARTGTELWAFIPPEFLGDQVILHANEASSGKHYGIDGTIRAHIRADDNGVIEPDENEAVYLFFGMRRGGNTYYGLDVSRPGAPRVLWRRDGSDLSGLGQSWSTPVPTRIRIQGAPQNPQSLVLVFGGGYDPSQDRYEGSTDPHGNALFIIDALSGERLWFASRSDSDFDLPDMAYSIPADVRVIDLDLDGLADRLYAADMGGQIWRFDIFNGRSAASLVTGGVVALLGGAPERTPAAAVTRRFYHAPDLALAQMDGQRFLHIGIGSGHRARPNSLATQDRFHALRDYQVFRALSQDEYQSTTPIEGADLVDITDNLRQSIPFGSPGWRLELNDGGWRGEKVLAESRTFNNQVYFTTFTPAAEAQGNPEDCRPALGTNRLYALNLFNGDPVRNFDSVGEDTDLTADDRHLEVPGSIPGEFQFLFPPPTNPDCEGAECAPPPLVCVGLTCLPSGFDNAPVRTYWREEGVE